MSEEDPVPPPPVVLLGGSAVKHDRIMKELSYMCCQVRSSPQNMYAPPTGTPMKRVAVDVTGSFPTRTHSHRFICVAMDYTK